MKGKLGGALFMILFSLPFAGVGAGAAYVLYQNVADSMRAREWLVVKAQVQSAELVSSRGSKGGMTYRAEGRYTYAVNGQPYTGTRLGLDRLGGSDNVGDWHQEMAGYLQEARDAGKPITVYVNPDDPADAVVDRGLRWSWLAFVGVFAVMFGGAGLGVLAGGVYMLVAPSREQRAKRRKEHTRQSRAAGSAEAIKSDGAGGVIGLWFFALVWNLISFPAAFLAVPQILEKQEYWGLFVLLFPLVGLLVLWAAINATVGVIRRGSAMLLLDPPVPSVGASFSGTVTFARDVTPGERYEVELACLRRGASSTRNGTRQIDQWSKTVEATASRGAGGASKLAFRHQAPAGQQPTTLDDDAAGHYSWRIEVDRAGEKKLSAPFGFAVEMAPAPAGAAFAVKDDQFAHAHAKDDQFAHAHAPEPAHEPAAQAVSAQAVHASLVEVFGAENVAKMPAAQRELMARLTPQQRAASAQVQKWVPRIVKIVIAIVVLQFVVGIGSALVGLFTS